MQAVHSWYQELKAKSRSSRDSVRILNTGRLCLQAESQVCNSLLFLPDTRLRVKAKKMTPRRNSLDTCIQIKV